MRRHRALVVIAACLMLFASQAGGQQPVHRIGVLSVIENPEMMQAWLEGLRERGYVVGRNLQIEYRYSQGQTERIPALVAELVAFGPEVIVALGPQNVVAVPLRCSDDPARLHRCGRPGGTRSGREPGTSGRQCDRVRVGGARTFHRKAAPAA